MAKGYASFNNKTVIIIGGSNTGCRLHDFLKENPECGYSSLGIFDDEPGSAINLKSYLGPTDDCINYAVTFGVDEIFCSLDVFAIEKTEQIMLDAGKNLIRFKFAVDYEAGIAKQLGEQHFGGVSVLLIRRDPLENKFSRVSKRLFDFIFSLFVIIFVFSWLYLILAILIKLGSDGPVFFVQLRSGRSNRPFKLYKFRSMHVNTEADQKQAIDGDQRITRIGGWLRRNSLDELPQFFNVLIGNMSVVGPRPHMIIHTRQYSELIDRFMIRHFLKPGITGWAQIKGFRGETKTTEAMLSRLESDLWYLENWSLLLDLKIIFLTFLQFFKKNKNAF